MYWDLGIMISLKLWHNLKAEITMAFETEEICMQLKVLGQLGSSWTVHTRERRLIPPQLHVHWRLEVGHEGVYTPKEQQMP